MADNWYYVGKPKPLRGGQKTIPNAYCYPFKRNNVIYNKDNKYNALYTEGLGHFSTGYNVGLIKLDSSNSNYTLLNCHSNVTGSVQLVDYVGYPSLIITPTNIENVQKLQLTNIKGRYRINVDVLPYYDYNGLLGATYPIKVSVNNIVYNYVVFTGDRDWNITNNQVIPDRGYSIAFFSNIEDIGVKPSDFTLLTTSITSNIISDNFKNAILDFGNTPQVTTQVFVDYINSISEQLPDTASTTFKHFYDAGTIGSGTYKFRHYSQQAQLATPQNVAASGTIVSWGAVENATSYEILVNNSSFGTVSTTSVDLSTLSGWASLTDGTYNITIVAKADGYTDSEPSAAVSVEKAAATKTLEESTWAEIAQVSANKSWDAMGWKVGDTKTITLNGTVGTIALNNYQCKVYILGFDHNADKEGQGISFGMLEGVDGVQLSLVDGNYNKPTSSANAFTMNTSNTNSDGWKNCHMRKTILGSTDVANGDATSAAITNPASGTLMAALPSDLRTVMKPITKYTNNVGQSSEASAITPTVDYLPLLSEYEVFKTTTHANTNEATYQAQYQYYANGKSKVKYQHNAISNTAIWWLRSPNPRYSRTFCSVDTGGAINGGNAYNSRGVAPAFLV